QRVVVRQPECADEERAVPRWQAIDAAARLVAVHETVARQVPLNCRDRPADTRVSGRQEADRGHHQQARVEQVGVVDLHECSELRIEAPLANLRVDVVAQPSPLVEAPFEVIFLRVLDGTVQGDPGHHLRVREVLPWPAYLPDAFIRFAPLLFETLEHPTLDTPALDTGLKPNATGDVDGAQ